MPQNTPRRRGGAKRTEMYTQREKKVKYFVKNLEHIDTFHKVTLHLTYFQE